MNRKQRRAVRKPGPPQPMIQGLFGDALGHHQAGRIGEAEGLYRQILSIAPTHGDSLHLLGVIAHQSGHHDAAANLIAQAIGIDRRNPAYHSNLGLALVGLGRNEDGIGSFQRAIALDPRFCDAHANLAATLAESGRMEEAATSFQRLVELCPNDPGARTNLGNCLHQLGRLDEAAVSHRRALALNPVLADAHTNLGSVLKETGHLEEAAACHRRALELAPDLAVAHTNLGSVLLEMGHLKDAEGCQRRALRLASNYAIAHNNLGTALKEQGRIADSIASHRRAIALDRHFADAHWNLGTSLLLTGDLLAGWDGYEWRWQCGEQRTRPAPLLAAPRWAGETTDGGTILLWSEQGLGDTIQFIRYAPLVAERGWTVIVEVHKSLKRLLSTIPGISVITTGDVRPPFDVQCPLLSLPLVFQTAMDTIPSQTPYLQAETERLALWRDRLGEGGFRIGVTWQGNPKGAVDRGRSIPLSCFTPLADIEGVRLISLQKTHGLEQLSCLPAGTLIEALGPDFDAGPDGFLDTAAVMMSLDLIITSDTSVAHLAGALGRPAWVVLQAVPDWRWLLERDDSPWYPTLRLFRQATRGDWQGAFAAVCSALREGRSP